MRLKKRSRSPAGKAHKPATLQRLAEGSQRFPAENVARGFEAFGRGSYDAAIGVWQPVVRSKDAPEAVSRALAEALFRRGLSSTHPTRQLQDLQHAVALRPEHAVYHLHLGMAHHRQGQLRQALTAYGEAHRLAPGDGRARRHLALAQLQLSDGSAAAAAARDLFAEASADDDVAARLSALAHLRAGDPAAAAAALSDCRGTSRPQPRGSPTSLDLSHRSPERCLALGLAQLAGGHLDAAQASLAAALESGQAAPVVRFAAALAGAVAHRRTGDPTSALSALLAADVPALCAEPSPLRASFLAELRRSVAGTGTVLAVDLLLADRIDEAIRALEHVLAAEPGHAGIRQGLAHLREVRGVNAAKRGDYAGAAKDWEDSLSDRPGDRRLIRNLALANERLERWEEAAARWEELIRQWRKDLQEARHAPQRGARSTATTPAEELRRWLAVAYRHMAGDLEAADRIRDALRTLERALNFDPSDVALRRRAAELYLEEEQYGAAIAHLRNVLAGCPNDVDVLLELGMAYDLKGDDGQAIVHLEQALALEPENPAVRSALGAVFHGRGARLARSGQHERAAVEYQRAIELAPREDGHYVALGSVYLDLGRPEAATAAFRQAVDINPADPRPGLLVGIAYLSRHDQKEAERYFREALRANPGDNTRAAIGMAYFRTGNMGKADSYFKRVLRGKDSVALVRIGELLNDADHELEAIPYFERAIAVDPLHVAAHVGLATACAFGDGDHDRAAAELVAAEVAAKLLDDQEWLDEIATMWEINDHLARAANALSVGG